MKKQLICLYAILLSGSAHAQLYNNTQLVNNGSEITDFGASWINGAGGTYTGNGMASFLHYGPSAATFVNNGSYDAGPAGSDQFLGPNGAAGVQEIGGSIRPRFMDLDFNNGMGRAINITNPAGIAVAGRLIMTSGIVSTVRSRADTGAVFFAENASLSAPAGNTLHVNGYVAKAGGGIFMFPVGDGASYCSLWTNGGAHSGDTLAVAYVSGSPDRPGLDPTGGAHSRSALNATGTTGATKLTSVSPVGFWDWVPVSGTSAIDVLVRIPDMAGAGGYSNPADMRIVGFNRTTGVWDNLSGSRGASSTAAGTMMGGTVPSMADYSALGIGSVGAATPLPVGLLAFNGRATGCRTDLEWESAQGSALASFTVLRSGDGKTWSAIGELPAVAGTGTYHFTDSEPQRGANFYRLQITDRSGEQAYSRVLTVNTDCGQAPGIAISPVSFSDRLRIEGMAPGTTIRIFSADGKAVWTGTADADVDISTGAWLPGMYTVQVLHGVKEVTVRNVVKR